MVHPLIHDNKRAFQIPQMGNGIFCQYTHTVGSNHFRNTVIDFRINMVWTTGQHDTAAMVFFHIFQYFFALLLHLQTGHCKFFPAFGYGITYFGFRNMEFFLKTVYELFGKDFFVCKRHERV